MTDRSDAGAYCPPPKPPQLHEFTGWERWAFLIVDAIRDTEIDYPHASSMAKLNQAATLVIDRSGVGPIKAAFLRTVIKFIIDKLAPGLVAVLEKHRI